MADPLKLACMNGRMIPEDEASIHVLSPAVKYASAVFEGLRGYWSEAERTNYVFRLQDHIDRLYQSMRIMRFETDVTPRQVCDWTLQTILENGHQETIHLRVLAYVDGRGLQGADGPIGYAITSGAAPRSPKVETGIKLGVSSWTRISDQAMPPRVKCIANYNNSRLAIMQARLEGHDNALFLTDSGLVAETTGSCFFMLRDGVLSTPRVTDGILESITRDTVIRLGRENLGLTVVERPINRSEIYLAEEAFVCGSRQEILPVVSIDHMAVGDGTRGALTENLQKAYQDVVEGRDAERRPWLEPVRFG